MPPPELQGTYQAMLEAARANGNCRFWLLHLRHAATLDSYPLFYDNEVDAVAWLVEQQERAGMRPVLEAPQKNS